MDIDEAEYLFESEDFYLFDDELRSQLTRAFQYVSCEDAKSILDSALFVCCGNGEGSWHLPPSLIRNRSVVILDPENMRIPDSATITILHEAAHSVLGHSPFGQTKSRDEYQRQEDEAWSKVREWLPERFHDEIERCESEGGGSTGSLHPQ
jgi:hypothetical protein